MLTPAGVRAARPRAAAYKISDGQGLYLHVAPTGNRSFRLRYADPATGREQTLTFGLWPEVSLDEARARRDLAREQIGRGENPRRPSRANLQGWTVEAAARAWHAHHLAGWSKVHSKDVLESLERDVLPAIGGEPLDAITRPRVLELLRAVERRGARETARRLRQRIQGVFDFARAEGWTSIENPADVAEALRRAPAAACQPGLVDVDELRELMRAVAALRASPITILASSFLAYTAVRLAALRGMRWGEVDELDGCEPVWRVPAARMKLGVDRKADEAHDHLVPLSVAAARTLRGARAIFWSATSRAPAADDLVFPSPRRGDVAAPIGAGAIGELYARTRFARRHVPHGWRASFSTVMNERRPGDRGAIDRALGHAPKDMSKVERAYNRAQHLAIRRDLLEEWGALIAPGKADDTSSGPR